MKLIVFLILILFATEAFAAPKLKNLPVGETVLVSIFLPDELQIVRTGPRVDSPAKSKLVRLEGTSVQSLVEKTFLEMNNGARYNFVTSPTLHKKYVGSGCFQLPRNSDCTSEFIRSTLFSEAKPMKADAALFIEPIQFEIGPQVNIAVTNMGAIGALSGAIVSAAINAQNTSSKAMLNAIAVTQYFYPDKIQLVDEYEFRNWVTTSTQIFVNLRMNVFDVVSQESFETEKNLTIRSADFQTTQTDITNAPDDEFLSVINKIKHAIRISIFDISKGSGLVSQIDNPNIKKYSKAVEGANGREAEYSIRNLLRSECQDGLKPQIIEFDWHVISKVKKQVYGNFICALP